MSNPLIPNFNPNSGLLATNRYDFESHITGTDFRQSALTIDLAPSINIDGYGTATTVQQALNILANIVSPNLPQANTTTFGLVKLSSFGDVQGAADTLRVVNIQGIPVAAATPISGDVLTFNGTSWVGNTTSLSFTAGNDLSGNNLSQNVISITGTAYGFVNAVNVHCNVIQWDSATNNLYPLQISSSDTSTSSGNDIFIKGQNSTFSGGSGGRVILFGGTAGAGGTSGSTGLAAGNHTPSIQVAEAIPGQIVTALNMYTTFTNTMMPANTGSGVTFIEYAAVLPTSGLPGGGVMMYASQLDNTLHIRQPDGNDFSVGSVSNPSNWGTTIPLTTSFAAGGQVYSARAVATSPPGSAGVTIFTAALPDLTATNVEVTLVAHYSPANTGATPSGGLSAQYKLTMGYERLASVPSAVGTPTMLDSRIMSGSTWTAPTISVSGNNLVITTGAAGIAVMDWTASIKLIFAQ